MSSRVLPTPGWSELPVPYDSISSGTLSPWVSSGAKSTGGNRSHLCADMLTTQWKQRLPCQPSENSLTSLLHRSQNRSSSVSGFANLATRRLAWLRRFGRSRTYSSRRWKIVSQNAPPAHAVSKMRLAKHQRHDEWNQFAVVDDCLGPRYITNCVTPTGKKSHRSDLLSARSHWTQPRTGTNKCTDICLFSLVYQSLVQNQEPLTAHVMPNLR